MPPHDNSSSNFSPSSSSYTTTSSSSSFSSYFFFFLAASTCDEGTLPWMSLRLMSFCLWPLNQFIIILSPDSTILNIFSTQFDQQSPKLDASPNRGGIQFF